MKKGVLFLWMMALSAISAMSATNEDISKVASHDVITYLQGCVAQIPQPSDFNLSDRASVSRAELGTPVPLLAVNDGADTIAATTQVSSISVSANRWYVPVSVDGTARFFIAVSEMGKRGGLMRSASGFAYLAAEYGRIVQAWPGHAIALITVPSTGRYFFTITDLGKENITAMRTPAERSSIIAPHAAPPPQDYSVLGTVSDALATVRSDKAAGGVK